MPQEIQGRLNTSDNLSVSEIQKKIIEEVYEPFLIQEGFLTRTPRGRQLTDLTYKHLGKIRNNPGELF